MADLTQLVPPDHLSSHDRATVFNYTFCLLASSRNTAILYSKQEQNLSPSHRDEYEQNIQAWAEQLLDHVWIVCGEPGGEKPQLDEYADTSTGHLPPLPAPAIITTILNTVLFLSLSTAKEYSARTRTFLSLLGSVDEQLIVSALQNPDQTIEETQKHAQKAKDTRAQMGKTLRMAGVGLGAVAGGVLIGVTGGLAAPLVGAGVSTLLGVLGVGGTTVGLLASGLASSSVICGALFGAYGARSTSKMVERHTREIRDLDIVPVYKHSKSEETLAVRLCVSGWLNSPEDVVAPWTIFGGDDTYALQWEVELLQSLSNALYSLLKLNAMRYIKKEVIQRTVFASLMSSLAPIAWLKIGEIIDNDWSNGIALAKKAGIVLADLLKQRVFGNRPITLTGYSLGGLVIFEALKCLAALPPAETSHLIQDVYLFGTPAPTAFDIWAGIRRLVSGRVVNGYSQNDYVLAVLSRMTLGWGVAGLQPIDVMGIENVFCKDVMGHTKWRGMIGRSLQRCGAPGVNAARVAAQEAEEIATDEDEKDLTKEEVDQLVTNA